MGFEIKTTINIDATPEKVWSILTDYKGYSNWNPFIKSLKGEVGEGKKINVYITPPNSKGMTFKPTILTYKPNEELRWIGRLLISGIFDGEHIFKLEANSDNTTTFTQSEAFKGVMVPLFKKKLLSNTKKGFIEMNEALKVVAEK